MQPPTSQPRPHLRPKVRRRLLLARPKELSQPELALWERHPHPVPNQDHPHPVPYAQGPHDRAHPGRFVPEPLAQAHHAQELRPVSYLDPWHPGNALLRLVPKCALVPLLPSDHQHLRHKPSNNQLNNHLLLPARGPAPQA